MTGTDLCVRLYKSVPVIFEPPCISLLYMFRASMCPSSGEKLLYLCDTGICHSVLMASGLRLELKSFNPTSRPDATHTQ